MILLFCYISLINVPVINNTLVPNYLGTNNQMAYNAHNRSPQYHPNSNYSINPNYTNNNENYNNFIRRQDRNISKTVKMGNNKLNININHLNNVNTGYISNTLVSPNNSFSSFRSESPNKKNVYDKQRLSNSNHIR
jgi:hypothetical protein